MTQHCLLIPADPRYPVMMHEYDETHAMADWQTMVSEHSGLFDCVATPDFDCWLDDEGLYAAQPIVNGRVMTLLSRYGELIQPLVGDAILTGPPDREGATTELDNEVVAKILLSWLRTP